ncbi:MAG: hypothetical protein HQL54_08895 [Magnetococcales bacterium]|nr:hypothetical protein [Magnetococcales bacterium]
MHRGILLIFALLMTLFSACGYRFPGDEHTKTLIPEMQDAVIHVEGVGAKEHPVLGRLLLVKLKDRLNLRRSRASIAKPPHLHVSLQRPERVLSLEDREGRADQYQVTLTANAVLKFPDDRKPMVFSEVQAQTSYYELREATFTQASREQARMEALEELAGSLEAILTGGL